MSQGLPGQNCRLVKLEKPSNFDCFSEVECKDRCTVVEEKVCGVKHEEKCSVVPKRECKTHKEKACNTFNKKVCDTVYEKECRTGMILPLSPILSNFAKLSPSPS